MIARPHRHPARIVRGQRNGLAVCELLAAFAVTVALVMLLIPAAPTSAGDGQPSPTVGRLRLFEALMNVHIVLSGDVVDASDSCLHSSGEESVIIDGFPGGAGEAAPATAGGTDHAPPS